MKVALTIVATALLVGCATRWVKPGGTQGEFDRDHYACQQQAASMYPPQYMQVMTSPGYQPPPAPTQTNCMVIGNQMNCQSMGGVQPIAVPPSYVTQDANAGARFNAIRSCLMANGWQPQR